MSAYPGLGFDPTPGEPSAVQAVLETFAEAGSQIAAVLPQLQSAVTAADGWEGDAAEEFSDYGDDIPKGLADGADSMGRASEALVGWFAQLTNNKAQAEVLDAMARRLKAQIEATWDELRDAQFAAGNTLSAKSRAAAQEQVDAIATRLGQLRAELEIVLDEARQLRQTHLDQANATAAAIGGAAGGFQPVSWGSQAAGVAGTALGEISAWTGRAAFVAALVPGGQLAAGVLAASSAATGVAGTGGAIYAKTTGAPGLQNTSLGGLVLDGVLSVGGPAGKGVGQALSGLRAARQDAAELGARGLAGKAATQAFDDSKLGRAIQALQDAKGASSVRDAMERIGQAKADGLAGRTALDKALEGTGMAGSSVVGIADTADRATGGKGLTDWEKLIGKGPDLGGLTGDAINAATKAGVDKIEGE
jgi:hypothetical protein